MLRFAILAAILIAASPAIAATDEFVGRAHVVDGDTLDIAGQRIRLNGIDAPESSQLCGEADGSQYRCGNDAAFALDDWLAQSRPTTCRFVDRDRYGRVVADCFRADNEPVNQWLVRQGWAVDWVKYSHGEYASDQAAAKGEKRGIWRGQFQLPCEFRAEKAHRSPSC